jgi:ubiquinone/menaquinone biosynthesis C-methylase UbiE
MGFYTAVILPKLCHLAMRNQLLVPYRERAVAAAEGLVLEIGMGSGLNLPFYRAPARQILGLEPSPALIAMACRAAAAKASAIPAAFIEGSAESIPLDDKCIDTVVTTWTLCTVPHPQAALDEIRRVLRPGGRLLFVEHGLAPDAGVRKWQDFFTPVWKRISGGCHLNRPVAKLIETAGFELDRIETGYAPGPRPMTFFYEGSARPR